MKKLFVTLLLLCVFMNIGAAWALGERAPIELTDEEAEYVKNNPVVRVMLIDGTAPLAYLDDGEPKGIVVELYEELGSITGFDFEYIFTDDMDDAADFAQQHDGDVFGFISPQHIPDSLEGKPRSKAFLNCKTTLFINNSIELEELDSRRYAAIEGVALPKGVDEETVIYFKTREECIRAVNDGRADYGFGNEFSVTFYTVQENLQNISVVPIEGDSRNYEMLYYNTDEALISIMSKAIESVDEDAMQSIILRAMTFIQKHVTFEQVISTFWIEITAFIAMVFIVIIIQNIFLRRSVKKNELQRRRLEMLAGISDEYIYGYDIKTQIFEATGETYALLKEFKELEDSEIPDEMSFSLKETDGRLGSFIQRLISLDGEDDEISCEMRDGSFRTFKITNARLAVDKSVKYVQGKFVDISRAVSERDELIKKAETDSMTKILNKSTFEKKTMLALEGMPKGEDAVMILFDIDDFKLVNDTYGHITGDKVIKAVAKIIAEGFPEAELIGRVGGDEFGVFIKSVSAAQSEDRLSELHELGKQRYEILNRCDIGISYGVAGLGEISKAGAKAYEALFSLADDRLYETKKSRKGT